MVCVCKCKVLVKHDSSDQLSCIFLCVRDSYFFLLFLWHKYFLLVRQIVAIYKICLVSVLCTVRPEGSMSHNFCSFTSVAVVRVKYFFQADLGAKLYITVKGTNLVQLVNWIHPLFCLFLLWQTLSQFLVCFVES